MIRVYKGGTWDNALAVHVLQGTRGTMWVPWFVWHVWELAAGLDNLYLRRN